MFIRACFQKVGSLLAPFSPSVRLCVGMSATTAALPRCVRQNHVSRICFHWACLASRRPNPRWGPSVVSPFSGISGCLTHWSLRPVRGFVHSTLSTDCFIALWNDWDWGADSVCI
eukprot:scaffold281731_cov31-Tisochrysis_lutea.AAC.1